jgi:hypothetical protein
MKLKDGLTLRTICNQHMIVDLYDDVVNMTNVYTLNDVAAWLWQEASKGDFTVDTLTAQLCEEYEVDSETAHRDVHTLITSWQEFGWVEDNDK